LGLCSVLEKRVKQGEILNWQVGNLPPFDPLARIAWRDTRLDLVVLRLTVEEAAQVGPCAVSSFFDKPHCKPRVDDLVVLEGYPKVLRELDLTTSNIGARPYAALFRVTSFGDGYCRCFVERRNMISFDEKPLPS